MNVHEILTKEEVKVLLKKSDLSAFFEILKTWGWIGLTFTAVAWYPSVFTIIPALFILGGKQLACAIIMHDASHRALFQSVGLNDFVGNWLGGYPVFNDCHRYRPYHLNHHVNTGTAKDPDISLTKGYPTTLKSFVRKMLRDLLGATGLKSQIGVFLMNSGYIEYTGSGLIIKINQEGRTTWDVVKKAFFYYYKPLSANLILFAILWLTGNAWLYLLWIGALLTTYNFSLRIRSMAEHSMVSDSTDPYKNTRTTYANWLEQVLFAPHHVNYHSEHHLLMTVPPYNLPKMHRLIKSKGFYEKGSLAHNYWTIVKMAIAEKQKMQGV